MTQENPIFVDRLTGNPIGEPLERTWNIEEIKAEAEAMGKPFNPPAEVLERLEPDLANGALVLFTIEDVKLGIAKGLVPTDWEKGLVELVEEKNDVAIIPVNAVEEWQKQESLEMSGKMLTQRRF
ncbi:hypothetical protein ACFLZ1_01645 [Patescibacteria group bacterium]